MSFLVAPKIVAGVGNILNRKIIMEQVLNDWCTKSKSIVFPLRESNYKGQAGKIAVIGGSVEYTGAPYFAAISALRVGADLVHIFCSRDAAIPIKCYSPELIVHPFLEMESFDNMKDWLKRMDVIIIGPGLGRKESTLLLTEKIVTFVKSIRKCLVVDADALFLMSKELDLLNDFQSSVVLTPNKMEFARLLQLDHPKLINDSIIEEFFKFRNLSSNIVILCKGPVDEIYCKGIRYTLPDFGGSFRRCGGQGDILAGSLATFLHWSQMKNYDVSVACLSASKLVRKCNSSSYQRVGRSMLSTDMIVDIPSVFQTEFESDDQK